MRGEYPAMVQLSAAKVLKTVDTSKGRDIFLRRNRIIFPHSHAAPGYLFGCLSNLYAKRRRVY